MYRGYQLPRSFVVQLSHPERLRFTIGDLEAVLAEFGYGDTRAERQLRLRLADARHRLRDAVPTRRIPKVFCVNGTYTRSPKF